MEEHILADELGIPTGETEPANVPPGPLGGRTFDDGFSGVTGPFALQDDNRRITVEFERGYPYAQVYAPEGQSLICFEPMTAPTNALMTGDLQIVQPGEEFTAGFRIAVE